MKKTIWIFALSFIVGIFITFLPQNEAYAASLKVMWGKTELKQGQLGKVTVNKSINLWKKDGKDQLSFVRVLKPGEEYRVYRYDATHGGQYGVGGGMWVTKMPTHIKYETPSKSKLVLLEAAASSASYNQIKVLEQVNQERLKHGAPILRLDTDLSELALEKSRDMQSKQYFAHNSPTYGSPFEMMNQFGIKYRTAGENIAMGHTTPEWVVDAWMNSEGHRRNILEESYTHMGIGHVARGNYWTQMFIGK